MIRQKNTTEHSGEKLVYWRSIENRRRTKEYLDYIQDEFAPDISDITHVDRRSILKFMGASVALAGIGVSCRRPEEKILPYVKTPEGITPGIANYFASSQSSPFGASGLLIESHEGRPTKVEGNPLHPSNLGKASTVNQASVLEIYDPDRSKYCVQRKAGASLPATYEELDAFLFNHFEALAKKRGEGLSFLCSYNVSPTFLRIKAELLKRFPLCKFYTHDPLRQINTEKANKLSFGFDSRIKYDFSKAKVIVSLFADPFSYGPDHINLQNGYSKNKTLLSVDDRHNLNRLYAVEADHSLTGVNADHRLRLPFGQAQLFIEALAYELHANHKIDLDTKVFANAVSLSNLVQKPPLLKNIDKTFVRVLAKDLATYKGQSIIYPGDHLPPSLIAMINALNVALGGLNKTFSLLKTDDEVASHLSEGTIEALVADAGKKSIDTLLIVEANPVHTAPRNFDLKNILSKIPNTIHLGLYNDETAKLCSWHIPVTHFLEHFADDIAFDGTVSLVQPLIAPLYECRSTLQILAQLASIKETKPYALVNETFKIKFSKNAQWEKSIHDGFISGTEFKSLPMPRINAEQIFKAFKEEKNYQPTKDKPEFVLVFDRKVLDGRYANHSWLQELPDPITKINWGNALLMSPLLAKELKVKSGQKKNAYVADIYSIKFNQKSVELPVFVLPGLSDYSVIASLGYGRKEAGSVGNGIGIDLYDFYSENQKLVLDAVMLERTGKQEQISTTQEQFAMNADTVQEVEYLSTESRNPAREADLSDYLKDPNYANKEIPKNLLVHEKGKDKKVPLQVTDAWDYTKGNQWGMAIDLSKCTSCNACVIACQSENNIPVVGREQVIRGRLMHWIRVDRLFRGDPKNPKSAHQPILCQHCENAPCEPVCPVAATSHDREGLNVMTYNRCIGTRYCANNCPVKVRRFNYFDFSNTGNLYVAEDIKARQKTLKLQRNPDVTVRYRGVMEKCTFCTQRIQEAKMKARRDGLDPENLVDGSVTPACAQTCPSEAITFGNINDKNSNIYKLRNVDRNYTLLDVLNIRPRTSYLSKVRNPHPELVAK